MDNYLENYKKNYKKNKPISIHREKRPYSKKIPKINSNVKDIPKEIILQAIIQNNGLITKTAELLDVNYLSLRTYIKKNIKQIEKLKETVLQANLDIAEASLFNLIKNGHFPAIKYYLDNKGKQRGYKPKDQIQNNIKNGIVIMPATKTNEEWIKSAPVKTIENIEPTEPTEPIENITNNK